MSDVKRPEEPPIRIAPVQPLPQDKRRKEPFEEEEKKEDSPFLFFASVMRLFEKCTSFFFKRTAEKEVAHKVEVTSDLKALHQLLLRLAREETSRRPEFVQAFSLIWEKLVSDARSFDLFKKQNPLEHAKMLQLLETIRNYPPFSDHTLGHYLQKHVGQRWFPFPFMEILERLHDDFALFKDKSELGAWIIDLSDLIELLEKTEEE